jgi:hypothetical protein
MPRHDRTKKPQSRGERKRQRQIAIAKANAPRRRRHDGDEATGPARAQCLGARGEECTNPATRYNGRCGDCSDVMTGRIGVGRGVAYGGEVIRYTTPQAPCVLAVGS